MAAADLPCRFTHFLLLQESTEQERKQNQVGDIRKWGRGSLIIELIILKMGTTEVGVSTRDAPRQDATVKKVTETFPPGKQKNRGKRMQIRSPGGKKPLPNFLFSHSECITGILSLQELNTRKLTEGPRHRYPMTMNHRLGGSGKPLHQHGDTHPRSLHRSANCTPSWPIPPSCPWAKL